MVHTQLMRLMWEGSLDCMSICEEINGEEVETMGIDECEKEMVQMDIDNESGIICSAIELTF